MVLRLRLRGGVVVHAALQRKPVAPRPGDPRRALQGQQVCRRLRRPQRAARLRGRGAHMGGRRSEDGLGPRSEASWRPHPDCEPERAHSDRGALLGQGLAAHEEPSGAVDRSESCGVRGACVPLLSDVLNVVGYVHVLGGHTAARDDVCIDSHLDHSDLLASLDGATLYPTAARCVGHQRRHVGFFAQLLFRRVPHRGLADDEDDVVLCWCYW
mmetsp:Transcript_67066/g.187593  ORF Transcript_67066/g.187593 Transcript_67066/m.187593 type:complete len:213 (+) Transcript_67066:415-1053(+)